MIFVGDECRQLDAMLQREWLETDGLGGYASGTVCGINTRRYHGVLVAEAEPGAGRRVLCAQLDETVFLGAGRFELSAHQYADTIHPQGYRYLTSFRLDPWPVWTWQVESAVIEKELVLPHRLGAAVVVYRVLKAAGPVALEVRPLVAGRDYHTTAFENWSFRRQADHIGDTLEMAPYQGAPIALTFPRGTYQGDGFWFYNFHYSAESELGPTGHEDLFNPGLIVYTVHEGEQATLIVGTEPHQGLDTGLLLEQERDRRAELVAASGNGSLRGRLALAADAFLVHRQGRTAVMAGYPWFEERQRDTLAALPGLCLATGRVGTARALLESAAEAIGAGDGEPDRVEAELWLSWAASRYLAETADEGFAHDVIRPALTAAVARWRGGRASGARVDGDGLVALAHDGMPLTWMDAWLGGQVFTPRRGKPVEVNALWYACLTLLAKLGEDEACAAAAVRSAFLARFWSPELGYLLDVVDGPEGDDGALRPNQLLAVSLTDDLVPDEVARAVVESVTSHLLTPYGPRSLDPRHSGYRGRYQGGRGERDAAYHQGTVWPWLLGPLADAILRCDPAGRERVARLLEPFDDHLADYGLGHVAQLFDGDPPQGSRGCIAHAWATAELLRIARRVGET